MLACGCLNNTMNVQFSWLEFTRLDITAPFYSNMPNRKLKRGERSLSDKVKQSSLTHPGCPIGGGGCFHRSDLRNSGFKSYVHEIKG